MKPAARPVAYACLPHPQVEQGGFWVETVQPGHIQAIRAWRNAQLDILRQAAPISPEQQEAYFAAQIWPALAAPQPANLLLSFHEGERLIGYGGLVHIAWEHKRAEVSFLLDPQAATPTEAYKRRFTAFLGLMKKLAFIELGFERLFTETYALRTDHIAVLEAVGFRREGVLRRHVRIDGRSVDSLMHGCLKIDEAR
jgi:RimJ/RimL family protein N-acetyltransferase